jgi:type VI secretion system secreted protein Hcp
MRSRILTLGAVAMGLTLAVAAALPLDAIPSAPDTPIAHAASVDYFLKIEGVEGESNDGRHKGEIEIQSFSWGVSQMGAHSTGGGGGAGKVSFQDISFMAPVSKASPKLMLATATGEHFKKAVLVARKAGSQEEYYTITLQDVLVSSFQNTGGASGVDEQFSLNFTKIEFEYKPQKADGSLDAPVKAGYDLKANKKI